MYTPHKYSLKLHTTSSYKFTAWYTVDDVENYTSRYYIRNHFQMHVSLFQPNILMLTISLLLVRKYIRRPVDSEGHGFMAELAYQNIELHKTDRIMDTKVTQ